MRCSEWWEFRRFLGTRNIWLSVGRADSFGLSRFDCLGLTNMLHTSDCVLETCLVIPRFLNSLWKLLFATGNWFFFYSVNLFWLLGITVSSQHPHQRSNWYEQLMVHALMDMFPALYLDFDYWSCDWSTFWSGLASSSFKNQLNFSLSPNGWRVAGS